MCKLIPLCILLIALHLKFELSRCFKKSFKPSYKNIKKLPKSEVDVKAFVFPCSIDEHFLNSSLGTNRKHLRNCNRKLIIRMTVNSGGEYCSKSDGFIPIDHVVDGITGRKKRLLHPLMLRIKRERMYQLYDLQLVKSVNAEAREDVVQHENTANFTGCDTSSSHPTCGYSFFKNKIIQFSEGFCCSCDQSINDQRQPCDGRPGERKYPPDMKLAVRHHRSNRSSRGLDEAKKKNEFYVTLPVNEEHKLSVDIKPVQLRPDNIKLGGYEDLIEGSSLKEKLNFDDNVSQEGKRSDDSRHYNEGITIRSYQFEHSMAPNEGNCSVPQEISNIDILINNDEQRHESNSVSNNNSSGEVRNSISPERLKLLIKNRIRVNENNEKVSPTSSTDNEACSIPENITKSPCHARSLFGHRNNIRDSKETSCKQGNKTFALKLLSGNSELEINIVTRTPTTTTNNKLSTPSKVCNSTAKSFKSVINNLFSKSTNESISNRQKETTKEVNCSVENKDNNINSLEKMIYQILPIVNNANSGSDSGNKKMEIVFKDLEKTTKNDYLQVCNNTKSKVNMISLEGKLHQSTLKSDTNSSSSSFESINSMISDGLKSHIKNNEELLSNEIKPQSDLREFNPVKSFNRIEKREACDRQIRGGQSCSGRDSSVPCYGDPETYFESAHCLRFSELWYNVHRLVNPKMENAITVKIYAKHKTSPKKACWEHLTKHVPGRVGTVNEVLTDEKGSIVIAYSSDDNVAFSLDCSSDFLLVPQPIPKHCKSAELKALSCGGPGEYLVLKESEISFSGEECDRAGVTFAAFARQPHRCQREPGACLKNQPLQFWRDDRRAEADGKRGQYYLRNYVTVTDQVVLLNTTSNQVVLRAPYYERYQSQVVVELNADHIDIIADRSEGQITEVYVDATSEKTLVKVVVTNMGIAADLFSVDFVNCTRPLGPYEFDKPGKKEIPPQYRITFTARVSTPLVLKQTECQLAVYGVDQEVVASRKVFFVSGERCVCVWHCRCVCHNYPGPGLLCSPLSLLDFHRAGFPGHLPGPASGNNCTTLFTVLQALLFFFLILLLFGLVKAVLGLCFPYVAVWGLWHLMPDEAQCLTFYLESELACRPVVFDCSGHPVHPQTFRRSVRFLPRCTEFIVNVLFFILFARSCVCDSLIRMNLGNMNYRYSRHCEERRARSAGCRVADSPCGRSPCSSVYSGPRRARLYAGGEEKDPQALADEARAQQFVQKLASAYYVYRNMTRPVGGVQSVPGTPYCVRGYFLESENGVYEFHPPSPLMQIWGMDRSPLSPPIVLDPAPFRAMYRSASEALAARELSRVPEGVVINER